MKSTFITLALCWALGGLAEVSAWSPAIRVLAAVANDAGHAARLAAGSSGGKVIDVQTSNSAGQVVYLVKVLLADGRVKVVKVSGAAKSSE